MSQVIDHKLYESRTAFDSAVDKVLEEFSVELICLAGFMRILSGPFVKKWEGKHSIFLYALKVLTSYITLRKKENGKYRKGQF